MDDETIKALNKFSEDLQEIVGEDLARSIINYAQRPNELEAEFLRSDGVCRIGRATKERGY